MFLLNGLMLSIEFAKLCRTITSNYLRTYFTMWFFLLIILWWMCNWWTRYAYISIWWRNWILKLEIKTICTSE